MTSAGMPAGREYVHAGVLGPGDRITSVVLGWVDIPVDQLVAAR